MLEFVGLYNKVTSILYDSAGRADERAEDAALGAGSLYSRRGRTQSLCGAGLTKAESSSILPLLLLPIGIGETIQLRTPEIDGLKERRALQNEVHSKDLDVSSIGRWSLAVGQQKCHGHFIFCQLLPAAILDRTIPSCNQRRDTIGQPCATCRDGMRSRQGFQPHGWLSLA